MLKIIRSKLDDAIDKVSKSSTLSISGEVKQPKFEYSRPEFLGLNLEQIQVSRDFSTRPVVVPQDVSLLPWNAGYAEYVHTYCVVTITQILAHCLWWYLIMCCYYN